MEVTSLDFIPGSLPDETLDLFKTQGEETHATSNGVTHRINSPDFETFIGRNFFMRTGGFLPKSQIKKVVEKCDNFARYFGEVKKVYHRFAEEDGIHYIDLCNQKDEVVEISEYGVRIIPNPNIKFIKYKVQQEIHIPNPKAVARHLRKLKKYIPFKTDNDFTLFVAWLLSSINTNGGYPVLFLVGEQGSAKSSTCRLIKDLLDGSSAALRNLPKSMKELMIAANNEFIIIFDNISKLTNSQSDNLCKVATGAVVAMRRLYTTYDEAQLVSKNPIVINSINYIPSRQDLLDRSLIVRLDFIQPEDRKTEKELMSSWESDRPLIFGALCQAASAALRNYDAVSDRNLPRMADFAKWVIAAEEALPWEKGQFMETMRNLRAKIVAEALESDPVAMAVLKFMDNRNEWSGSATDLLELLETCIDQEKKKYPGFPKIGNHLSRELERVSAFLREKGIQVERRHSGQRFIDITRIIEAPADVPAEEDTPMEKTGQVTEAMAAAASNQLSEETPAAPEEGAGGEESTNQEFTVTEY